MTEQEREYRVVIVLNYRSPADGIKIYEDINRMIKSWPGTDRVGIQITVTEKHD